MKITELINKLQKTLEESGDGKVVTMSIRSTEPENMSDIKIYLDNPVQEEKLNASVKEIDLLWKNDNN